MTNEIAYKKIIQDIYGITPENMPEIHWDLIDQYTKIRTDEEWRYNNSLDWELSLKGVLRDFASSLNLPWGLDNAYKTMQALKESNLRTLEEKVQEHEVNDKS